MSGCGPHRGGDAGQSAGLAGAAAWCGWCIQCVWCGGCAGLRRDGLRIVSGAAVEVLPATTQRLMLIAAAEPAGEPTLVWRAAERLGIGAEALAPAADAGLLVIGERVTFRHPLVRSAAYRAVPPPDRRAAHRALAGATDPQADPDRRAWHRAQATLGPDEDVASELERSASRAQARGGLAAAAAFLERAAALTLDPARRAERALAAAQAKFQAGAFDATLDCWPPRRLGRRMSSGAPGRTGCAARSRSPPAAALTHPRCC